MQRRELLKMAAITGLAATAGKAFGQAQRTDGTPLQFIPKTPPDPNPLQDELQKYPHCPYCGMDRARYHQSRHLVQYEDDLVDGTCSIHCLALSLGLNVDRGPKAIYAADYGSEAAVRPLINVDQASYLIGSQVKGTMTARSKLAFGNKDAARAARRELGGEMSDFDGALKAAYEDMARDTIMIRKRRAERRARAQEKT